MNIIELPTIPDVDMAARLETFESQFSYSLGEASRFRISHSPMYTAFYRSQGEWSVCLLAVTDAGEIAGTVSATIRTLKTPTGSKLNVAYIGDLKVAPHLKTQRPLIAIAKELRKRLEPLVDAAYGVVMNGTSSVPSNYTGRLGIPSFVPFAALNILRFSTEKILEAKANVIDIYEGHALYELLTQDGYAFSLGTPALRSNIVPCWYAAHDKKACGMLEDTRRAKRLFMDSGEEILSSHLSYFAVADGQAAREVIITALVKSRALGFHGMFLTLDDKDMRIVAPFLGGLTYSNAPATIYATKTLHPFRMKVNSSEV